MMYKSKKKPTAPAYHVITVLTYRQWCVCIFLFDVTFFFANSACARGARGHPGAAAHHRGFVSYTHSQCVRCLARVLITRVALYINSCSENNIIVPVFLFYNL